MFKPVYYWDAGREAVPAEQSEFLTEDGLIGNAFMLHSFKLSSQESSNAFWQVSSSLQATSFSHFTSVTSHGNL